MGRDARSKVVETTTAPAAPKLSETELAKIHGDTQRMGTSERIIYWDKRQATPATAMLCPNDKDHGPLVMTGSGAMLICGVRKQGAVCTGSVPVSI